MNAQVQCPHCNAWSPLPEMSSDNPRTVNCQNCRWEIFAPLRKNPNRLTLADYYAMKRARQGSWWQQLWNWLKKGGPIT